MHIQYEFSSNTLRLLFSAEIRGRSMKRCHNFRPVGYEGSTSHPIAERWYSDDVENTSFETDVGNYILDFLGHCEVIGYENRRTKSRKELRKRRLRAKRHAIAKRLKRSDRDE